MCAFLRIKISYKSNSCLFVFSFSPLFGHFLHLTAHQYIEEMLIPTPITCKYRAGVNCFMPHKGICSMHFVHQLIVSWYLVSTSVQSSTAPTLFYVVVFHLKMHCHCSSLFCFCHLIFSPIFGLVRGCFSFVSVIFQLGISEREGHNPATVFSHIRQNHSISGA